MKKLILASGFWLWAVALFAQQDAQYSMYMFNLMAINPAYAGTYEDEISATLSYRNQWLNFDRAPKTTSLSVHSPIQNQPMGVGLSLLNDKLGVMKRNSAVAAYSYRIELDPENILAFGLQTGFSHLYAKLSDVQLTPPTSSTSDPAFTENVKVSSINFGSGAYWYSKKYYVSFSVPKMFSAKVGNGAIDKMSDIQKAHFFLTGGYVFPVNEMIKIKPSVMTKISNAAPVKFDINANVYFYDIFGIGLSYHTFESFSVIAEFYSKKNMWVGYAFDYTLTSLRKYNFGSHEIMVRYNFSFGKSEITSARFF